MPHLHRLSPRLFIALFLLVPCLLFWRWLVKGEVLFWGTLLLQFWPWQTLVKQSLLAGEWPLWTPLLGNGAPLLANLQTAVFYPLNFLYLLLPVEHGLTLSVLLHLVMAGLFMFLYTRRLGLAPFAATVSGLAYMLSGYITGRTQFVTMVNAAAWLPLLLLLAEGLARRPSGLGLVGLGLGLAMPLLAGHAQLWYYSLWLVAAYVLFRSGQAAYRRPGGDWKPVGRALIGAAWRLGLAVGLVVLLAAVQILPTAELTTLSPRSTGAERVFALTYSFWPWRLLTLLLPDLFGNPARGDYWGYANYWEDHAYLGVLPFILALVAVGRYLAQRRQAEVTGETAPAYWAVVPFFAALVPISLVLALGWNTPLYLWLYRLVPGFAFFQAPARLLIWYTVAMAVLAGVGAHIFDLTARSRRNWQRLLVASAGITVAVAAASLLLTGRSRTFLISALLLGLLLGLSILLLLQRPAGRPGQSIRSLTWQWLVVLLVSADLLRAALPLVPAQPAEVFSETIASAEFLKQQPGPHRYLVDAQFDYDTKFNRYFRFSAFGPDRLDHWQTMKETLIPNLGVYAGLPSANNFEPLVVGHWQQLLDLVKTSSPADQDRLLALMNVGYLIGDPAGPGGPPVYQTEVVAIRRVAQPLPRAYFVPAAYPVKTAAEAAARLSSADFDSAQEAVIMLNDSNSLNGPTVPPPAGAGPGTKNPVAATVTMEEAGRLVLNVAAPAAGVVVLTDTFYPGWQATLDGQAVPVWQANLAFRAVPVETGQHEIIFYYTPGSFRLGLWLSGVTWLAVGIFGLSRRRAGNRAAPDY